MTKQELEQKVSSLEDELETEKEKYNKLERLTFYEDEVVTDGLSYPGTRVNKITKITTVRLRRSKR